MFPKGPRFVPPKSSDVPGPNAYDMNTDYVDTVGSETLEAYKKGAFLESADRFAKEKESEVPGPGSSKHETNARKNGAPKNSQGNDRLIALQRRVDELERVHNESKKAHQAEVERLKADLARAQRSTHDLTERLEKSKKHSDLLEAKNQELRKSNLSDQAEIKDLRVKLKLSEHERSQLVEKQDKALASERRKREAAETQWQGLRGKGDAEVKEMRTAAQSLEARLKEAQEETKKALIAASDARQIAVARESELLEELGHHKALLQRVAQEYGRMATSSVAKSQHMQLKREHVSLQVQVARLGRKLANSEAQVVELAHLIRNVKSENDLLRSDLLGLEWDIAALFSTQENFSDLVPDHTLQDLCSAIDHEARSTNEATLTALSSADRLMHEFYTLSAHKIKHAYLATEIDLGESYFISNRVNAALKTATSSRNRLESELDSCRAQLTTSEKLAQDSQSELIKAKARVEQLEVQCSEADARSVTDVAKLKQEKSKVQRLTEQLAQSKEAENNLRAEADQLSSNLAEAERYQEAYCNLYEIVADLAARNELAESEAERLSKFNAEIIGHANPAQRIMYLDRIRAELAETKHALLTMTRAHESAVAENEALLHEIDLYKSVTAHPTEKVRSNMIRVHRQPLGNVTKSADSQRNLNPIEER